MLINRVNTNSNVRFNARFYDSTRVWDKDGALTEKDFKRELSKLYYPEEQVNKIINKIKKQGSNETCVTLRKLSPNSAELFPYVEINYSQGELGLPLLSYQNLVEEIDNSEKKLLFSALKKAAKAGNLVKIRKELFDKFENKGAFIISPSTYLEEINALVRIAKAKRLRAERVKQREIKAQREEYSKKHPIMSKIKEFWNNFEK